MSSGLEEKIRREIRRGGVIDFAAFMQMALYEPGLGYYARPEIPIGPAGDFYTAPRVQDLFGAMLGRQVLEFYRRLGAPDDFTVTEVGAGDGRLAAALMDYLRNSDIYDEICYVIVEQNHWYRRAQEAATAAHAGRISWAGTVRELPRIRGCLICNELLDAFPVHLVEQDEDGLAEIGVGLKADTLVEVKLPASALVAAYMKRFAGCLKPGYRTEASLLLKNWLANVASRLDGFLLVIDYGFPAAEYFADFRNRGTLRCYHRHRANDEPLARAGDQDITAHVNFSALHRWGMELGMRTLGFCAQGPYLVSLGMEEMLPRYAGDPPDPLRLARIKSLIMPQGLGETHKVLIQAAGGAAAAAAPPLAGFSLRNEAGRL